MKQFILFRKNEYAEEIQEVFTMLLGKTIEWKDYGTYFILVHRKHLFQEIEQTVHSLENDLNTTICAYQSYEANDLFLEKELQFVLPVWLMRSYGCFCLKTLLPYFNENRELLDFILEKTLVTPAIIETMAECNLNVSSTAAKLYMHRNSLLYKLDRLKELKNFDLRTFRDCYLLYRLL